MATYKGDNSTVSLLVEDNGWGKPPTAYTGAQYLQNIDGTFDAARNALESESRTPNSELSGVRLGNNNVSATFNVELDPKNYDDLFESLLYSRLSSTGTPQVVTAKTLEGTSAFRLKVELSSAEQVLLGVAIGDPVRLYGISLAGAQYLEGGAVVVGTTATHLELFHPSQKLATLAALTTDFSIARIASMRPAKMRKSFNAEEVLTAEDGTTKARFMTVGALVSSLALDLPQEGNIKAAFSMLGSGKHPSQKYSQFDPALTNSVDAHVSPAPHVKYTPMVLQDGAILSGAEDTRCIWLSGSLNIENGTETYFVGCSYDAAGATSGKFRITVNYEALFQSEDDYVNFTNENSNKMLLRLKDRTTDQCVLIYMPALKLTSYTMNNSTGLVTASLTGSAEIDTDTVNSVVIGLYSV